MEEELLEVDNISITPQGIHVLVKVLPNSKPFLFFAIYASLNFNTRIRLCVDLCLIADSHKGEWLMGGDFNEVLQAKKKLGGTNINLARSRLIWDYLNKCSAMDLSFKGSKFTWTIKGYCNRGHLILERLDRRVANDQCIKCYLKTYMMHLPRVKSDHSPLLISLSNQQGSHPNKPFRMESMWCGHPSFISIVSNSFTNTNSLSQNISLL